MEPEITVVEVSPRTFVKLEEKLGARAMYNDKGMALSQRGPRPPTSTAMLCSALSAEWDRWTIVPKAGAWGVIDEIVERLT